MNARSAIVGAACAVAALLSPALLGGCESIGDLRPGATSVLDLGNTGPTPAEAARWAIDPYDPDKRYRGTLLLANAPFAGESVYIQLFTDNIKDVDPGVRAAAARGIGSHGSPDLVPLLVERLEDQDPSVRTEAARALQRLHNPVAVDPLLDALDEETELEAQVRLEAANALGQYAETRVVERLISALEDPNLAVNRNTQGALRTLTGQDFGFDRAAWQTWYKNSPSVFAARGVYVYPVYRRGKNWYEYVPFIPPPPNESASVPAGMTPGVN